MGNIVSISPFTGEPQFSPIAESTSNEVDSVVARSVVAGKTWSALPGD